MTVLIILVEFQVNAAERSRRGCTSIAGIVLGAWLQLHRVGT